jgi:intracellular septation protein
MKLFFDFLPIILFFIAYKFAGGDYSFGGDIYHIQGIYAATAVMIVATIVQVSYTWLAHKKVERSHLITLVLVVSLGGLTLWFQNPDFIMWKPTAVNWLFALAFLGGYLFTGKSILEKMLADQVTLPHAIWRRLNTAWVLFFLVSGLSNIYVAYNFDENTWVNFKLFGMLGMTLVFVIAQSIYLARHAEELPTPEKES